MGVLGGAFEGCGAGPTEERDGRDDGGTGGGGVVQGFGPVLGNVVSC